MTLQDYRAERILRVLARAINDYGPSKVSVVVGGNWMPKFRVGSGPNSQVGTVCAIASCDVLAFYGRKFCRYHYLCHTCGQSEAECARVGHVRGCTYVPSGVHDPDWRERRNWDCRDEC